MIVGIGQTFVFQLTLPPHVAKYLQNLYSKGGVILEYGTGGSTLLALEAHEKNVVFGCETDPRWLARLSMEVAVRGLASRFVPVYQDIGATREWGRPCFESQAWDSERGMAFVRAPMLPWLLMERRKLSPDVILIDGRFRVASFIASFVSATQPVAILFDDYVDRPAYHVVEDILKPVKMIDRAALFQFDPLAADGIDLKRFLRVYAPLLVAMD